MLDLLPSSGLMLSEHSASPRQAPAHPAPRIVGVMDNRPAPAAAVSVSEHRGVLYLHLGTQWIQGGMRLDKPDAIEIEYVRQMMMWTLFQSQPRHIVQLGLGAGALTKFCYRQFTQARVTAIELNPAVIAICRSAFALPPDDARLSVIEMDALDFVSDPGNHGAIDVLQVDLYDADARGPVFESPEFYQACADCLTPDGMMTFNLFGDFADYQRHLQAMEQAFDAVAWLPEVHDANVVVIAFKHAPVIEFGTLYQRAAQILRALNLQAKSWVDGLKIWMRGN